jgi:hypothetical protein
MTVGGTCRVNDHDLILSVKEAGGEVKLPDSVSPVGKEMHLIVR